MVTLKMLAKQCGVSVATVSKALNGAPDISAETAARIQKEPWPSGTVTQLYVKHLLISRLPGTANRLQEAADFLQDVSVHALFQDLLPLPEGFFGIFVHRFPAVEVHIPLPGNIKTVTCTAGKGPASRRQTKPAAADRADQHAARLPISFKFIHIFNPCFLNDDP